MNILERIRRELITFEFLVEAHLRMDVTASTHDFMACPACQVLAHHEIERSLVKRRNTA